MEEIFMKKMLAIVMSLVLVLLLGACSTEGNPSSSSNPSSDSSSSQAEKEITVGVTFMTLNSPFFEAMQRGVQEEADKSGVKAVISDAQLNSAQQISSVENLIAQKVDVILLNAVDSKAVVPAVEAANEAGIPVICLDVMAEGGEVAAFIASNNLAAGEMGGEFIAEQLGGKGDVVILDGPPISSFQDRAQGFENALKNYTDINIVQHINAVENSMTAFVTAADNILSAHPDLSAVLAVNDYGSIAVESAVKSAAKDFDVISVGVDGMEDAVNAIVNGDVVAGSVAQQPAEMGRIGIQTAIKLVNGETVEETIDVPLKMLTKETAEGFSW